VVEPLAEVDLVQLGALAFFKYSDYFLPRALKLLRLLHLPSPDIALTLLLPVGLSFYTLQAIAYLVDIYQGKSQPASSPLDFALYMAYFPRLVAGPIERAGAFMGQLHRPRRVDNSAVARGLALIVVGLVRKTLVADVLRPLTNFQVFRTPAEFSGPQLIATLIAFAIYVYNDFAGYTSLVRGVSALFGIELTSNFNLPFFSRSFTELWNRWHISLSAWLRDYIYYPLSRAFLRRDPSSRGLATLLVPPLVTLAASGLWHGASWNMLAWGALNGLFLAGERMVSLTRPALPPDRQPRWRQWLGRGVVLTLVLLALVPFQSSHASNTGAACSSGLRRPCRTHAYWCPSPSGAWWTGSSSSAGRSCLSSSGLVGCKGCSWRWSCWPSSSSRVSAPRGPSCIRNSDAVRPLRLARCGPCRARCAAAGWAGASLHGGRWVDEQPDLCRRGQPRTTHCAGPDP
jgi:D-alanyl-lipoteichoic acid acyltransferase DltB (MBOAT superfamily)